MIAVVDYHKGNLKSVERGLIAAGGDAHITDDAQAIAKAEAIVLPGVGAFADAAATMEELGQMEVIFDRVDAGVPFLGICLGLHLMYEAGDEGALELPDESELVRPRGLGFLPGIVTAVPKYDAEGNKYKIPHVGWNSIEFGNTELAEQVIVDESYSAVSIGSDFSQPVDVRNPDSYERSGEPEILGFSRTVSNSAELAPLKQECALLEGIREGEYFYFTHSYQAPRTNADVALTQHSVIFPSVVQYGDVAFGVQFHPEKSSDAGAAVLRNFVNIVHQS